MRARQDLDLARDLVRRAGRVVILTGAGISTDSGIPAFRSPDGLWRRRRPEELATPEAFARDPRTVWEWYDWRRQLVLGCSPNEGHRAIAKCLLSRQGVTLITQNVDGLHGRALDELVSGTVPRNERAREPRPGATLELHGNLLRSRCSECLSITHNHEPVGAEGRASLPRCRSCHGLLRPDVVWFGEPLDEEVLMRAIKAARTAHVCISAGTSAVVQPAAQLPLLTKESGGSVIEVNPDITPISKHVDIHLRGSSTEFLPEILDPLSSVH